MRRFTLGVILALIVTPATAASFRDCSDCPEMVVIPAGTFVRGSPETEEGRYVFETPQEEVSVKRFALGKYHVTFDQWEACVDDGGCNGYRPDDEGWGRGKRPVINVSWMDAQGYVRWLNRRIGRRPLQPPGPYRLPSEAEWEYAARAGTTTTWWCGADPACLDRVAVYEKNSGGKSHPVGTKAPNPLGLYDITGNVWQHMADCYIARYEDYRRTPRDGSPAQPVNCAYAGGRGGSWFNPPQGLRSAMRVMHFLDLRMNLGGFRVAKSLD